MLVLSGNTDAWELLPDDVKQRVGLNVIDCPLLDLEEAIDIVRIYVTPPKDLYTPGMGSIRPFAEDAVRTMLSAGGGNPRKFLQLCYLAYQEKEYQTKSGGSFVIGESLVRKLIRDDMTGQFVDRDRVVQETRRLLARGTGQLLEKFSVAGMVFDFALLNAGGNPALLVDLKALYALVV